MGAPACARLLVPWTSCPNLNPSGWDDISVWDLLRTKLRRKKKWKTSKDWTKMVAGYAWKTFSSLSGSLSFGAGFVWKLCVPTKSDWNTTKALLDVFLFFCIFLFCQFICHPSPIKQFGWNTSFFWPTRESLSGLSNGTAIYYVPHSIHIPNQIIISSLNPKMLTCKSMEFLSSVLTFIHMGGFMPVIGMSHGTTS